NANRRLNGFAHSSDHCRSSVHLITKFEFPKECLFFLSFLSFLLTSLTTYSTS
ncbi:hypothetical protein BgiMline_019906, partial [Biomphalaria glabrata]